MRHLLPVVGPLAALSLATACAAPVASEESGFTDSHIQGGAADTKHSFAVGIRLATGAVCTGTLIAPNLVMTAQHCVSDAWGTEKIDCATSRFKVKPVKAPNVTITTETQLKGADKTYRVSNVVVPNETEVCGSDLALLVLEKSVPAKEAKPAVPLLSAMTKDKSVSGEIAAIGYGVTSKSAKDAGQRRIKESIEITCIPGGSKDCGKRSESDREFRTEGGACTGDSGSGAFEQSKVNGKAPLVLGVLSRVTFKGEKCTDGVYTRTDAYSSLIIATGVQAWRKVKGTSDAYAAPSWTGVSDDNSKAIEETFASADEGALGEAAADALGELGGGLGNLEGGLGEFLGGIDWSKIIDFVMQVVPKVLEGVTKLKPREDTNTLTETPPADPLVTDTPAGNERSTDTSSDDNKDDDKDAPGADGPSPAAANPTPAASGCSVGIGPSSPSSALLLPALGVLVAAGASRRRRRSA